MNKHFTLKNILLLALSLIIITLIGFAIIAQRNYPPAPTPLPKPTKSQKDGLTKEDLVVGTGDILQPAQSGRFHYVGKLENGTEFDNSYTNNSPFNVRIGVGEVIKGWDEGLPGMKVGGKRKLLIPAKMAYGDKVNGVIPANSNLIFEVELLAINP